MIAATLGLTAIGSCVDGFTLSVVATLLLMALLMIPWTFKIYGYSPIELLIMSGYFKPVLIGLAVVVSLNALGSDSDFWSASSGVLLMSAAMLPLRKKLAAEWKG